MSTVETQGGISLLHLPRELRDMIYNELYDAALVPKKKLVHLPCEALNRLRIDNYILYPKSYPKYTLLPILHTSRQIRQEFLQIVSLNSRIPGRKLKYHLDLPHWQDLHFPTWRVLPLPPVLNNEIVPIESVQVDYRIVNEHHMGFVGNGGPGSSTRVFFKLLTDFANHGPQWFYDERISHQSAKSMHADLISITLTTEVDESLPLWKADPLSQDTPADRQLSMVKLESSALFRYMSSLARIGYLQTIFDKYSVSSYYRKYEDNCKDTTLHENVKAEIEEWEDWNFHWGFQEKHTLTNMRLSAEPVFTKRWRTNEGFNSELAAYIAQNPQLAPGENARLSED